uniref:Uncharacterized protein n=1 Tax=Anguilla anguilla TaxID=7936 RepID=A0A0E9RAC0_ANGAN
MFQISFPIKTLTCFRLQSQSFFFNVGNLPYTLAFNI